MSVLKNCLIKASAGTGKTFALATRMIRLMLLGVAPNHIVALTFSRSAAGEIFSKIADRLADAATSDTQAEEESGHVYRGLDIPFQEMLRNRYGDPIPQTVFASLLRELIITQHMSMIGTIDSFMTRMVQAFPLELGLQGSLTIMDDYRAERERNAAIARILNRTGTGPDDNALFRAFRQALFGREGKTYGKKLQDFVSTWHTFLLDYPDATLWGRPETIWPGAMPFPIHDSAEHLAQRLTDEIRPDWIGAKPGSMWDEFCAFVRTFNGTFPNKASVNKVLDAYQPQAASFAVQYVREKHDFTGEKALLLLQTVETLFGLTLLTRCESTQGIYNLMAQIESAYAQNTRNRGLLTFDDIPRLIGRLDQSVRQNIEYRFDGRFRHWALDEFQDTSRGQWAAIHNLVDEVIQSGEDERSIFLVGDMKQAIYGWRGGDVAIFERELSSGCYEQSDLSLSHRYSPQIANLVNRVFEGGRIAAILSGSAREAGEKWRDLWTRHTSQEPDGAFHVGRVRECNAETGEDKVVPYLEAACSHLHAVRPWERGLNAAILVRTNDQGQRFAEALRRSGIPAVWEGESAISDTPAVSALLHALKVAVHPGDTLAWRHVCASPLARTVFLNACALPQQQGVAALSRHVLDDVSRLGLPRTLQNMADALSGIGSDPFTRARLNALLCAATQFVAQTDAESTLTDFIAFVGSFKTRDVADTSTVKILTIHRSKGLGFDFVILPVIENDGITTIRPGKVLTANDESWLLSDPGKHVTGADPRLSAARERTVNRGVFENLCVYYVAMTRVRRALVMLLKPEPKKASETLYFSDLVAEAFDAPLPWSDGDPRWFERPVPSPEATQPLPMPAGQVARPKRRVIRRMTPSSASYHGQAASKLFSPRDSSATQRGTRLHEALCRLEWLDAAAPQPSDISAADLDLTVPSTFRDALIRQPHAIELWRERPFELIANDEWISGVFDRVVFFEEQGTRRAEIFDYKSNRCRDGESETAFAQRMYETYVGQMTSYRHALAQLSGLPEHAIRCSLLLTSTRQAVPV
ncbi:MAG: UvrD-helicase domain-containing protein [Kiritimatiellae bacterium]|nr:UvrD-helicase domain-containing protein [Kiritimatiellia bacterium]